MEAVPTVPIRDHKVPSILVVEDDTGVSQLIQLMLDRLDCEVRLAYSGEQALRVLQQARAEGDEVDLVLLDIRMPGIDGYEVIARVKSDPDLCHTSFIVITALDSANDKALGLEMGADDYLTKPFHARELLARIDAVMRVRRSERAVRRRNQELAALIEINRRVTASLDLQEVLETTVQGIRKLVDAEAGAVVLRDEDTDELIYRISFPMPGGRPVELTRELVAKVVGQREAALVPSTGLIPECCESAAVWREEKPNAVLCVPFETHDRTAGAIVLLNEPDQGFDDRDVRLVTAMATTLAVALDNARLYADLAQFTEQLERSQAKLVQAEKMAAIGRLAASLAHEINNPLQGIHNSLHLALQDALGPEKRHKYVRMAQVEVERLVGIVQRMLEFYRPSHGDAEPSDVNEIVNKVLALAQKRLQHGRVDVDINLADDLPVVPVVSDQIAQVILNLVINSVEAMEGGGLLQLGTRLSRDCQRIEISVHDSGRGMSEAQISNLFEPFYTTKSNGTGLGLAISYGIVERHGGTIDVESSPGEGTTFTVTLPARDGQSHPRAGVPQR